MKELADTIFFVAFENYCGWSEADAEEEVPAAVPAIVTVSVVLLVQSFAMTNLLYIGGVKGCCQRTTDRSWMHWSRKLCG